MTFTPGPWTTRRGTGHGGRNILDSEGTIIAMVSTFDDGSDAYLIAAAPDMLAALKTALAWYEPRLAPGEEGPICNLMSAAISKAEGNTA